VTSGAGTDDDDSVALALALVELDELAEDELDGTKLDELEELAELLDELLELELAADCHKPSENAPRQENRHSLRKTKRRKKTMKLAQNLMLKRLLHRRGLQQHPLLQGR
jgi:hypothetical protein